MSQRQVRLCKHLLIEQYGDTVASVGTLLLNKGATPLRQIASDMKMKLKLVKKSVTILIQHNVCSFERTPRGVLEYSLDHGAVLAYLRYPRYIHCAKSQYDAAAEIIVEELLQQGRSLLSDVITKATERLNESLESQGSEQITSEFVRQKFATLVQLRFVKSCPLPSRNSDNKVTSVPPDTDVQFTLSTSQGGKRKVAGDDSEQPKKKMKTSENSGEGGDGLYWRVNYPRFHLYFRDRALVKAISRRVDAKAGEVVRAMLLLSEGRTNPTACMTTPVSVQEIKQGLPKDCGITKVVLDQYLKILIDDSSEIVSKVDDSCGAMYSINILKGLRSLAKAHIESMIQEKYGSKCLRIFRILLTKRQIEQKQIEETAMVNIKESKEMLYRLYSHGLINATELCKTPHLRGLLFSSRSTFLTSPASSLKSVTKPSVTLSKGGLMNCARTSERCPFISKPPSTI